MREKLNVDMKRRLKKLLATSVLMLLITVSGLATVLLFPNPLFAHEMQYKQVTVYANDEIDEAIIPLLEQALQRLEKSELYDEQYQLDLFLAYGTWYNDFHGFMLGGRTSATSTGNNVVMQVRVDVKGNSFFPTYYQSCQGSLVYLLTHEMVHNMQYHKYGIAKFNPLTPPSMWKLEGYPEYVARQPRLAEADYDLVREIDHYLEQAKRNTDGWMTSEEGGCKAPLYYYKGRLMTEYLMDIKGWSYDRILKDTTTEDSIFEEMCQWRVAKQRDEMLR